MMNAVRQWSAELDLDRALLNKNLVLNGVYILKHTYSNTINEKDNHIPVIIKRIDKSFITMMKPNNLPFLKSTSNVDGQQLSPPKSTYRIRWAFYEWNRAAEDQYGVLNIEPTFLLRCLPKKLIKANKEGLELVALKDLNTLSYIERVNVAGFCHHKDKLQYEFIKTAKTAPPHELSLRDILFCLRYPIE